MDRTPRSPFQASNGDACPPITECHAHTVSISSPIGKALVNKAVGDEVVVQTPSGRRTLSVVALVTLFDAQG